MSELNYNPGAEAIFENNLPKNFISRKDEDMTKYPTIIYFADQELTIFSKKTDKKKIIKLINRYNGRKGEYNTRGSRPIVVELIKKGDN